MKYDDMEKKELKISYTEYETEAELSEMEQQLLKKAREASERAYAPYSNFYVGAALWLDNGIIVSGNNQENVAYPSGLCAERVAIYAAGAQYPDVKIRAIAVTCKSKQFAVNEPLSPCGACRQAIAEYEQRYHTDIRIILTGETGKIRVLDSISDMLPFMFKAEELKKA
ncbi:MAG: cytidine deaminase [Bacteroidota bacterium]|nr:cytidine deaminase [Bacteroidota bacterium]